MRPGGVAEVTLAVTSPIVNAYQAGLVGETSPMIGQIVCTSGSNVRVFVCRTVDGLNETTNEFDVNRNPTNIVTGQIRLSGCATGGDSGGPALAGNRAVGLLVSSTCGVVGATSQATFAQPLQPLLAQNGLRLLTVGNPTFEPLRIESAGCGREQTGPGFVCFARWAGGVDPATASWAVPHLRPTPYVITNAEARVTEAHFACFFDEAESDYFTQATIRDAAGARVSWTSNVCAW
jgi:hypothetical protein